MLTALHVTLPRRQGHQDAKRPNRCLVADESTGEVALIPSLDLLQRDAFYSCGTDDTVNRKSRVRCHFDHIAVSPDHSSIFVKHLAPLLHELWNSFFDYQGAAVGFLTEESARRTDYVGCVCRCNFTRNVDIIRPWCRDCSKQLYSLTRSVLVYGSRSTTDRRSLFVHLVRATGQTLVQRVNSCSPFCNGGPCSLFFSLVTLHPQWGARDVLDDNVTLCKNNSPPCGGRDHTQREWCVAPKREPLRGSGNVSQRLLCAIKRAETPQFLRTAAEREDHALRSTLVLTFIISRNLDTVGAPAVGTVPRCGYSYKCQEGRPAVEARFNVILLPDSATAIRSKHDANELRALTRVLQACAEWREEAETGIEGGVPTRSKQPEAAPVSLCDSPLLRHLFGSTVLYVDHIEKNYSSMNTRSMPMKRSGDRSSTAFLNVVQRYYPRVSPCCGHRGESFTPLDGCFVAVDCVNAAVGKSVVVCCVNSGLDYHLQARHLLLFAHRISAGREYRCSTLPTTCGCGDLWPVAEGNPCCKQVDEGGDCSFDQDLARNSSAETPFVPKLNETANPSCREVECVSTCLAPSLVDVAAGEHDTYNDGDHSCGRVAVPDSSLDKTSQSIHTAVELPHPRNAVMFGGFDGWLSYGATTTQQERNDGQIFSQDFIIDADKGESERLRVGFAAASSGARYLNSGWDAGRRGANYGDRTSPALSRQFLSGEPQSQGGDSVHVASNTSDHKGEETEGVCAQDSRSVLHRTDTLEELDASGRLVQCGKEPRAGNERMSNTARQAARFEKTQHRTTNASGGAPIPKEQCNSRFAVGLKASSSMRGRQHEVHFGDEERTNHDEQPLHVHNECSVTSQKKSDNTTLTAKTLGEHCVEQKINKLEVELLLVGHHLFFGASPDKWANVSRTKGAPNPCFRAVSGVFNDQRVTKHQQVVSESSMSNPQKPTDVFGGSENDCTAGKDIPDHTLCWKCHSCTRIGENSAYKRFLEILRILRARVDSDGWLDRTSPLSQEAHFGGDEGSEIFPHPRLSHLSLPSDGRAMNRDESSLLLQASRLTTTLRQGHILQQQQEAHEGARAYITELEGELKKEREMRQKLQVELVEVRCRESKYKAKLAFIDSTLKPLITGGIMELEAMIAEHKKSRGCRQEERATLMPH